MSNASPNSLGAFKQLRWLLLREAQLEWQQKYTLSGILFYAFCMVFIISLSLSRSVNPAIWNGIFWIILLFAAVNTAAKSFLSESPGQRYYLYQLAGPGMLILARILYNAGLLIVLSLIILILYALFSGFPVQSPGMFALCVILGSMGFASVLTLISGISALAGNRPALMAILGFPILIPFLNVLIRMSRIALDGLDTSLMQGDLLFSGMMILLSITLSYLLFPYLWRE
jgi:heme exporter protein B